MKATPKQISEVTDLINNCSSWKVKLSASRWLNRSDLNTVDVDNVIWKLRPLRFPKFSRLDPDPAELLGVQELHHHAAIRHRKGRGNLSSCYFLTLFGA